MRSVKASAKAARSRAQTGRRAAPPVARVNPIKSRARNDAGQPRWLRYGHTLLSLLPTRRPILTATLGLAGLTCVAAVLASGIIGRGVDAGDRALGMMAANAGFGVNEVHLSGAKRTAPQDILTALGFHMGQSIFGADVHEARDRLLQLEWVKTADLRRRFPDDITVAITEKQPFALWHTPEGTFVVERNGAVITNKNVTEFADLPRLIGLGAPEAAADLVDAIPQHRAIAARLKGMQRVGERRWNLVLDDNVVVQLPEKNWHKELTTLENMIVDKGILERDVSQIDLRSPTTYFFLLRNGTKTEQVRGKRV